MRKIPLMYLVTLGLVLAILSGCSKKETVTPVETPTEKIMIATPTPTPVIVFEGEKESLEEVVTVDETYVNQVLSGSQVREAIASIQEQRSAMAILVSTQMVMDGVTGYNEPDGNITEDTPTVGATGMLGVTNTSGESLTDKMTFINYGAVLKGTAGKAMIEFTGSHFIAKAGLDRDGDKYVVNNKLDNTVKSWSAENIADYLHMQSYLIKDAKDTVVGIAFYAITGDSYE